MGEVYRATDSKLKRDVALKVLSAGVAGDPSRLARFQREAELLARERERHRIASMRAATKVSLCEMSSSLYAAGQ